MFIEVLGSVLKCFEAHWSWRGDNPFFLLAGHSAGN